MVQQESVLVSKYIRIRGHFRSGKLKRNKTKPLFDSRLQRSSQQSDRKGIGTESDARLIKKKKEIICKSYEAKISLFADVKR